MDSRRLEKGSSSEPQSEWRTLGIGFQGFLLAAGRRQGPRQGLYSAHWQGQGAPFASCGAHSDGRLRMHRHASACPVAPFLAAWHGLESHRSRERKASRAPSS